MRFFITGSAGFIGFHLSQRLLADGHDVLGFDGLTPYYNPALKKARHSILEKEKKFTPVIGKLEDEKRLFEAGREFRPDVIVHLAAQAGVRYSLENPRSYIESNVVGTFNILELAKTVNPEHLLLASTSSIYGANEKIPFAELDSADAPLTIYSATKKSSELMAHSYSHLWKIPTTAFRFFTVYGPWGRPDMALFKFISAIRKGEPIEVYGNGEMRRDFTYVDDLVEAIIRIIPIMPGEKNRQKNDSLSENAPFRVINIGGGQPVGLIDFIGAIEKALGVEASKKMLPMQKGDVPQTYADPSLLSQLTGYLPSTKIEKGILETVNWFNLNPEF